MSTQDKRNYDDMRFEVDPSTYAWTERLFDALRKVFKVHFKVHQSSGQIEAGEIFLFNHFARFETFIPQYFIYKECGAYCRSVASGEFFESDDPFARYLTRVGAIPNDLPELLPLLAREVLRGRKVVVFPEGGMVKDRRVVDDSGTYSVYSRTARMRRKHHTGGAVLAVVLDTFKKAVLKLETNGDRARIRKWSELLELESPSHLLSAARRPTVVVPANITFYPIRVSDNLLRKGAELLNKGLSRRMSEELLIEGNILLKETDMDIRLGTPVGVDEPWRWWEKRLLDRAVKSLDSLPQFFALTRRVDGGWERRLVARKMRKSVERIRDEYMRRMYVGVTINLSHLASTLVHGLLARGKRQVSHQEFHALLYWSVKFAQLESDVYLHRSLADPSAYVGLLEGDSARLAQFFRTTTNMELVERTDRAYRLSSKLLEEHAFDEIRLENLVEVYANEAAAVDGVGRAVEKAFEAHNAESKAALGEMRFEDEVRAFAWDKAEYSKERHKEINDEQTAVLSGEPYLLRPQTPNALGVVLVHGFLASPAELRSLGDKLCSLGYTVLGVRLKGHGTSPWDLRDRSFSDWLLSVRRAVSTMRCFVDDVVIVGFSMGGALALHVATERMAGVRAVVAACAPFHFQDRNMAFVPLVHRANTLVRWVSSLEGVKPFQPNTSEHPQLNYAHMPIRGLYELRQLVDVLVPRLAKIECPVCLMQSTADPVIDPRSIDELRARLTIDEDLLEVVMIESDRHGIVANNIGESHASIVRFLAGLHDTAS